MAASGKFDSSSGSPDRSIYTPRGSTTGAYLDKSGSFRENKETPILSSFPSMSRSSASVTKGDVTNFFNCLCFDSKSITGDYKFSRQLEFKRLTSVALGLQVDDSPPISKNKLLPSPSPEDLKRLKAGLRESSSKARERLKNFNGAMSVMNKCFLVIPSRKRSRLDGLSSEKASTLLPSERSVVGTSFGKAGTQTHVAASGFELEPHVPEEKVKIAFPNKRTRTSMVDSRTDMRGGTPARSSGNMDREALRLPSTGAVHGEERSLSVGVDSWGKSKMKKKRSGIKTNVSLSSVAIKPADGFREAKQGMQPRPLADARLKLNDSHGFRQGVPSGAVGVGKADSTMQPTSVGVRSSIPKAEQDRYSHLHDRRDRSTSVDKGKANLGAVYKTNSKEDFNSPSPTSNTKMKAAARAPRSGSNVLHKLSPVVQRTTVASDWELSQSTSKNSAAVGANNRKHTAGMQPTSPPVTQLASQRPQKFSRSARRTNFVPIVSSNDESPALDATSDVTGNETGSGSTRRLSTNSPQQVKLKGDQFSSPALSESDESGATETKVRDKMKKTDEVDEKASPRIQKVSTLPPRKNKLVNEGDQGDGVCRQGRSGRGFTSTRSVMPITGEKLGNLGKSKQLRSARTGFEKTESKVGRPPSRKLSDRKPFTRQKQTTTSAAADFHDDGHEELLAAAAAVTDLAHCFSSPFWRRMEPYFSFISDSDLTYLKQQGNPVLTTQAQPILNSCSTIPNGFGLTEAGRDNNHMKSPVLYPNVPLTSFEVPLFQRLMSALITEEECEELYSSSDGLEFDVDGIRFELEKLESNHQNHQLSENFQLADCAGLNGHKVTAIGKSINNLDPVLLNTNMMSEKELIQDLELLENNLLSDQTMELDNSSEFQYCNMSLDEKILLELASVGLSAELLFCQPDLTQTVDEDASTEIGRLKDKHLGQVSTAKEGFVGKLFSSASETRSIQEKEFEHHALEKLLAIAYEKYMASWGLNPSGGKNTSSKMVKQAALDFVKRTLEHCHQFEDTGKICFSEAFFKNIFISGSARLRDAPLLDGKYDTDLGNHIAGGSLEIRGSAAMGTQQSSSVNNHDIYSFNPLLSINHSSEQFIGNEDLWLNGVQSVSLGIGGSLSSSAIGKRSDRDREGKGSRNGTPKVGRTMSGNFKGERKIKTKPKQKGTQSSTVVSGLVNKLPEQSKVTSYPGSSGMMKSENFKEDDDFLEDPIDLSHLQLPGMDVFGGPDDLDGQGQDFGSWLNIDDELPDQDGFDGLEGLEIPMDDLADLNMKF